MISKYNGDGTKSAQIEQLKMIADQAAKEQALPMTETVLNIPQLIPQDHQWIQQGRHIIDIDDQCPKAAVSIPPEMTLIKDANGYRLVSDKEAVELNRRK